jgi:hypothetical protein
MRILKVVLPENDKYQGRLELKESEQIQTFPVSGTGVQDGRYRFVKIVETGKGNHKVRQAYGQYVISFENRNNPSKRLALHGGEADENGLLLPTHGNIRMLDQDLKALMPMVAGDPDVSLEVTHEKLGFFKRLTTQSISQRRYVVPSEVTQSSPTTLYNDDNTFFWLWLMNREESTPSVPRENPSDTFHSQGGSFGGGGAGGSFETPSTAPSQPAQQSTPETEGSVPVIVDPFANEPQVSKPEVILENPDPPTTNSEPPADNPDSVETSSAPSGDVPGSESVESTSETSGTSY